MRKVLFISADQWRGECLSSLGHACVRTPHLDGLARHGTLFRSHYTQASPCSPARTSLLTGLYMMNHRSLRNGTPLDARHTNVALEARKAGYDPTLFGYTDTSPDPRRFPSGDPVLTTYEGVLPGMSVGLQLPDHMAAWIADLKAKGYQFAGRHDVYQPRAGYPGAHTHGHSFAPPIFTAEDSETTFVANEILKWLSVRRDENRQIHHPVLLGTEQFFAIEEEYRLVCIVDHLQFRYAAMVVDFRDANVSGGQRLVERGVTSVTFGRRSQRNDREILKGDRRS